MVTIAILMAVIWYFGSALNSVLKGAGEESSREFKLYQAESDFRRQSQYNKLGSKIIDSEITYSEHDVTSMLHELKHGKENKNDN